MTDENVQSSSGTERETSPPLADFDPWKVGQPDDGIIWLYKSSVDGFWRIIKDEDHALEEATGYPVGELIDHEKMGDYDDSESGELRAIYVPPAEPDSDSDEETTACVVCGKDLTDPKNAGDPDENGDWVCTQNHCRAVHDVPMTVERTVIRTQGTETDPDE